MRKDPTLSRVSDTEDIMQNMAQRVACNLALYIAAYGPGEKTAAPRAYTRGKKRRQGALPHNIWVLRSKVKLGHQVIADAKRCLAARDGWRVKTRFTVRGHWRNQACGKGRKDRKRLWIHPHWKGPDDAQRVSHLYEEQNNG